MDCDIFHTKRARQLDREIDRFEVWLHFLQPVESYPPADLEHDRNSVFWWRPEAAG
ncbi:MAG: hypothetical protein KJ970_20190 [Candidatus Eisenbacteria bacterium]|uniref:Uncharacterized protein n=1 Tax=Eiseniibacteriota bacterium TaxID=2212470 RepID=A0A948S3P3_UNCEI|nr:hypothetical protein [Candidatus Eisenbacteria bacterium]